MDSATAYEKYARDFLRCRDPVIGCKVVRQWVKTLPNEAEVIEIACGCGDPVTNELVAAGLQVWALDSSPTLVGEFKSRFTDIPIRCEKFQDSVFFCRTFDAAIAVGLVFLLPESEQASLIARVASVLVPGGRFLFTAPKESGSWKDITTGIKSLSLGQKRYQEILEQFGFQLLTTYEDEGKNNYYDAKKLIKK